MHCWPNRGRLRGQMVDAQLPNGCPVVSLLPGSSPWQHETMLNCLTYSPVGMLPSLPYVLFGIRQMSGEVRRPTTGSHQMFPVDLSVIEAISIKGIRMLMRAHHMRHVSSLLANLGPSQVWSQGT